MADYNVLEGSFNNSLFDVKFDLYTPRPHFILLTKESEIEFVNPNFSSTTNVFNANAVAKNIRFYISGEDNTYLDLSSVRLFATLQNNDRTRHHFLRPLGGLHAFIQRYRAIVGGQMDRNIVEYNRHCELYVRDMDDIEMSANPRWDADFHVYANGLDVFIAGYYCWCYSNPRCSNCIP